MVKLDRKFKPHYGLMTYAFAIGALLVGQVLAAIVISVAKAMGNESETLNTAISLIFQLTNLGVFAAVALKTKSKPTYYLKMRRPLVGCVAGAAFGVVSLFCFLGLAVCGQLVLEKMGYNFPAGYVQGIRAQDVILLFLTVIAAPVCEELIFRSALLSGLRGSGAREQSAQFMSGQPCGAHFGGGRTVQGGQSGYVQSSQPISSPQSCAGKQRAGQRGGRTITKDITASLLCGLAFSLMHMNPEQTVYQFCLGFGASMLALSTGSVIPAMIMHAVSNLVAALDIIGVGAFSRFFAWYDRVFFTNNTVFAITTIVFSIVGAAVFIVVPLLIKRYNSPALDRATTDEDILDKSDTAAEGTAITTNECAVGNVTSNNPKNQSANQNGGTYNQTNGIYNQANNQLNEQYNQTNGLYPRNTTGQKSGGRRMWLYFLGVGVCAFMWLIILGAGLLEVV